MNSFPCALVAIFGCCGILVAQQPAGPRTAPPADLSETVSGSNAFAVDLYVQLRSQPGNLFFSPESISTAFAMAYAGARGQTATEVAHVFHYSLPPGKLHPAMGALLAAMNAQHTGYELHVADALWAQQDENFLASYLSLVQSSYGAGLHKVNFKSSPETVRATINKWTEQQTNDRIQNLLAPGTLTPATRLVLTNAVYFKGDWLDQFDKKATETGDFHISSTQAVQTPLMHHTGSGYRYSNGGAFQVLEMPYKGNDLSMVVLLPNETGGLAALEHSFSSAALSGWLGKLQPADKVILTLPRFKMTQQFELSRTLAAMGMPLAFSSSADFSAMTGRPEFTISAAIHKAFVDVNETGTEAAAATATVMLEMARQAEPPPIVFRADHPFLFLIRDTKSGSILFLGRVTDPTR
jgi:serpin B